MFPVGRLHRSLRHVTPFRIVSEGAAVYLAAVLEYLCAEVLILANAIARHHRTARITPRHVQMAIQEDEDVRGLLDVVQPYRYCTVDESSLPPVLCLARKK
eukprot:COSAG01_NODE_1648_length_9629_cov_9.733998_1_plen_101_part_00